VPDKRIVVDVVDVVSVLGWQTSTHLYFDPSLHVWRMQSGKNQKEK
jgi:hypothetical protein